MGRTANLHRAGFGRKPPTLSAVTTSLHDGYLAPPLLLKQASHFVEVEMNALDLLTDDHQKVKRLFEQAQQIQDNQQKKEMFDKIDMELAIHADIEETIFYPALEEHDALKEMVREARQEHETVEQLLLEIEDLATEDTDFSSQLVELEETVDDHVAEEEGEMFPKIREIFDDVTLEALGKRLESAKGKQINVSKSDLQIA
jgi:hemerythrin superfamily protein